VNRNLLIIVIFIAGIIILPALGCRMPPKFFPATFLTLTMDIFQIAPGLQSETVNVYAHLGGLLLGLLIPSLIWLGLTAQDQRQKAAAGAFIGLTLFIPSAFWILMPY